MLAATRKIASSFSRKMQNIPLYLQRIYLSLMLCFLKNPAIADIYTEHAHPVTVAKYAPSGFYIASGGK